MGRKPKFDRDVALDKATKVFWKKGFASTSLADLLKAMNLGESSFYHSFKSKKNLYVECVKFYNANIMSERKLALNTGTPKERIYGYYNTIVSELDSWNRTGCLMSNSLSADVLAEEKIKPYIFDTIDGFLAFLTKLVADGVEVGEFRGDLDPGRTARILFTYSNGLFRLSPYRFDPKELRKQTHAFLEATLF